tara:strand:+ start:5399 stop:8374 length:2976 start_codon:yes stop_codon:yes gene_type:complete
MSKKIQLYIDSQTGSADFVELDLFEDEPIKLVDSIQKVTAIDKIFDTFSRDFKVPASPNNNRIFKGFANSDITNGFDSRVRIDSLIKINGQDFKKGRIRLLSVGRTNNGKANFYKISFQGGISTIQERIGDKKLSDLSFDTLKIPYNEINVLKGIRDGLYATESGGNPLPQITLIRINSASTISSLCRVQLNGITSSILVSASSVTNNAIEIASAINSNSNYTAYSASHFVVITANSTALQTETVFDPYLATGLDGSATTVQWGGTTDAGELDENGIRLYPDIIYAPIFTDAKVVAVPVGSFGTTGKPTNTTYDFALNKFTGIGANNTSNKDDDAPDTSFTVTPISPDDYKPSVKVARLLRMMAIEFNLPFQKKFFHMEEIDQLYMFFNGKKKEGPLDNKANAFNTNTSTELSQVGDSTFSKVFTTETSPLGNATSFTGSNNIDDLIPLDTNAGWAMMNESIGSVVTTFDETEIIVGITLNAYIYDRSGLKVIINSKSIANADTDDEIAVRGLNDSYNRAYFSDQIAGSPIYYEAVVVSSQELISNKYKFQFKLNKAIGGTTTEPEYDLSSSSITNVVTAEFMNIEGYAPDIKCMDLLTGVFKMFNLTAFINDNDEIEVQTLNDYYAAGKTIDITNSVLTDSDTAKSLGFKYNKCTLKFQEPEDILTKNYSSLNNSIGFGDIEVDKSDFLSGTETAPGESIGDTFEVELPFQSMMFEQLSLSFKENLSATGGKFSMADGGLQTDMVIGNCIASDLESVDTKPILFYGKKVATNATYTSTSSTAQFIINIAGRVNSFPTNYTESGNTAGRVGSRANGRGYIVMRDSQIISTNSYGLANMSIYRNGAIQTGDDNPEKWWNPSGIMASRFRRDSVTPMNHNNYFQACRFNNDNYDENEFSNEYPSQKFINGLYQTYYEDYLKNIFKKTARLSTFKVMFSQNLLSQYKLNDTFVIGAKAYNINKIEIDVLTGAGTVELLNKLDLPDSTPVYNPNA